MRWRSWLCFRPSWESWGIVMLPLFVDVVSTGVLQHQLTHKLPVASWWVRNGCWMPDIATHHLVMITISTRFQSDTSWSVRIRQMLYGRCCKASHDCHGSLPCSSVRVCVCVCVHVCVCVLCARVVRLRVQAYARVHPQLCRRVDVRPSLSFFFPLAPSSFLPLPSSLVPPSPAICRTIPACRNAMGETPGGRHFQYCTCHPTPTQREEDYVHVAWCLSPGAPPRR